MALAVKNSLANVGDIREAVQFLPWEDALEKGKTTQFSILAWRIPWTEEPGSLHSIRSQRVRHCYWLNNNKGPTRHRQRKCFVHSRGQKTLSTKVVLEGLAHWDLPDTGKHDTAGWEPSVSWWLWLHPSEPGCTERRFNPSWECNSQPWFPSSVGNQHSKPSDLMT